MFFFGLGGREILHTYPLFPLTLDPKPFHHFPESARSEKNPNQHPEKESPKLNLGLSSDLDFIIYTSLFENLKILKMVLIPKFSVFPPIWQLGFFSGVSILVIRGYVEGERHFWLRMYKYMVLLLAKDEEWYGMRDDSIGSEGQICLGR